MIQPVDVAITVIERRCIVPRDRSERAELFAALTVMHRALNATHPTTTEEIPDARPIR